MTDGVDVAPEDSAKSTNIILFELDTGQLEVTHVKVLYAHVTN